MSCIQKSEEGVLACAHGWEKSVCTHTDLGQAFAFSLGLFPLGASTALGRAPHSNTEKKVPSGSDTTTYTNEMEEGGCAKGGLRRNEEEPELGEGILPSPKQEPPRAPLSRAECEEQAAPRNEALVALAETARGGCRGWISHSRERSEAKTNSPRPQPSLY